MKKQRESQTENENNKKQILLNNIINKLLQNQIQSKTKHEDINLMELSDLLIWCQKKNPDLLRSMIEMDVIKKIVQSQNDVEMQIRSFVLLVNNCKINGDIIVYLLVNQIIDQVITKYIYSLKKDQKLDLEQKLQYLGSLLKAYNMHLNSKTFPYYKYKGKGQSLLIKICTRFYNCPQQLTRTSVMNILMGILKADYSSQFISVNGNLCSSIQQWCKNLCCQFRNQLKDINQKLFVIKDNQIETIIQQINDKIFLWEDLSETIPQIFQINFKQQVIIPLIVGSLNTQSLPLFNIKFTFFILAKLMKVFANLGLIQYIGDILLTQNKIKFKDSSVSTAVLKGFDLKHILNDQYYKCSEINEQQMNSFSGTHQFFKNMLKSKDPQFLQIGCNFLQHIIMFALMNESSKQYYINNLGITNNGFLIRTFTQILINQFRYDHPLSMIVKICSIISYIQNPQQYLSEDSLNIFVFVYKQLLIEVLQMIENNSQHLDYISQIYEYDLRTINTISLQPKVKKDKDLLLADEQHQDQISFYQKIPQIPRQYLRYKIIKVILLKKFKFRVIQSKEQNIIQKYIQRLDQWDQKSRKGGQKIYFPLKMKYFQCQLIEDKLKVPCILLDDEIYFILGFIQQNNIKIMLNLKMKHLSTQIIHKKDNHFLQITIRKYNYVKQNLQNKNKVVLKKLQNGSQYIAIKKMQFQQKQMGNIIKTLKRMVQQLPKISLI